MNLLKRSTEREVAIPISNGTLRGILNVPPNAIGVIAFAHGSGSGRLSPRNRFVAKSLQNASIATLLVDLLQEFEEDDRRKVFDVELLAERLQSAIGWLRADPQTKHLPIGLFGASTGAAAALIAAANDHGIFAVVSRGGRPDLAGPHLADVQVPTLLLVGGNDDAVLELNERAQQQLTCKSILSVVPGATHLFEEPGTLNEVARRASTWLVETLNHEAAPTSE